jgi:DNA-binding CsgD family transcriptional regulator
VIPHPRLTAAECEALSGLIECRTSKDLARKMDLNVRALDTRISRACGKLGGLSRVQAVVEWDRWERAHRV